MINDDTFIRLTLINMILRDKRINTKELKDHDLSVFDRMIIMHC
jgi:hypothetical protein